MKEQAMKAYAIARLTQVTMGPAIVEYLERIGATLAPFGGRFVIHGGGRIERLEGNWTGDLIVVEFPDRERARAWYGSPAYRAILPLRTENSEGDVILADGVSENHRATDVLVAQE
jgi:uncharacterized protein (DUF1330 family)